LSRIGLHVTQRVLPTGPYGEALRNGDCDLTLDGHCQNVVNPLLDVGKYLPHSVSTENYENAMTSRRSISITRYFGKQTVAKQRILMREFENHVLDTQAHETFLLWKYRIVPYRSYVKGWKSARATTSIRTWRRSGSTGCQGCG
jgi:peptide/nickel transport system substrate-binding protein